MKYLAFANNDKMPALGLGTWKSAKGEVYEAIRTAIKLGYRHFDCAHLYMNEAEIGEAFADAFKAGDVTREELFVTSKLWNNRHRQEQVRPAFELTIKNLQLDYLDLYLIHWPVVLKDDVNFPESGDELVSIEETPLSETWKGMIELQKSGDAKHIGVSNFSPKKIQLVWDKTDVKPEVNQVEMHPFMQQKELKSYCDKNGIILTAYAPLGSADRPKNRISEDEPNLFQNETIKKIAADKGTSEAQVMLAWAVNYGVSVIPKSVNEGRLKENLAAAEIELATDELNSLSEIDLKNRYVTGDFWCLEGSSYTMKNLWDE
ncbi:MAG: alcohol dehydrogenase (NADP+) [Spirosomataceae bacterium]|jgi:alcohol dehydrogenase (NADP+)